MIKTYTMPRYDNNTFEDMISRVLPRLQDLGEGVVVECTWDGFIYNNDLYVVIADGFWSVVFNPSRGVYQIGVDECYEDTLRGGLVEVLGGLFDEGAFSDVREI